MEHVEPPIEIIILETEWIDLLKSRFAAARVIVGKQDQVVRQQLRQRCQQWFRTPYLSI